MSPQTDIEMGLDALRALCYRLERANPYEEVTADYHRWKDTLRGMDSWAKAERECTNSRQLAARGK